MDIFSLPTCNLNDYLNDPDNFLVGMVLEKSREASDKHWRVQGIASCELPDSDNEEMVQKGIDCSPLLEWGQINWDHQDVRKGPDFLIGEPLETAVVSAKDFAEQLGKSFDGPALWTVGELYQDNPIAQGVWRYLEAQKAGLRRRRLGWSVQGRILQRDKLRPRRIVKSAVHHLAITHQPILRFTFADLAKSFSAEGVLSTESGQPLLREQVNNRITSLLYGDCKRGCFSKGQGGRLRFHRGVRGALEHLHECHAMDVQDATEDLKTLIQGGFQL